MSMAAVHRATKDASEEVQIIQMGYCFQVQKAFKCSLLDLSSMRRIPGTATNLLRTCGQKMLLATPKGLQLLRNRLLRGPPCFYDHCVGEMQRTGIVKMMNRPLCGSRRHFSLVTAGNCTCIQEELAVGSHGNKLPIELLGTALGAK